LAIVFGSSWFDQEELLLGVRSVLGSALVAGESTAGEIVPEGPISHSCVVVLLTSTTMACSVGVGEGVDQTPREAGQRAAYAAAQGFSGSTRTGFLLFEDGLVTNSAEVTRGIQEVLGTSFLLAGGMAADDSRFVKTSQYAHDRVFSRSIVGVLLGGSIRMGVGMEHGFAPISKPRRITRAKGNILFELDEQPAASVYEEYFGADLVQRMRQEGLTRQAIAYPLGIQSGRSDQWLLRNVVSFGTDGSLSCNGELVQGSWLQLMIGSRQLALDAAQQAARQAIRSLNHVSCALVFESVVRRTLLGPRHAAMEVASIREAIGASVPLAGCYTYGEQAPVTGSASSSDHSSIQTGSVLVVALGT
jgi:hypothetical protein